MYGDLSLELRGARLLEHVQVGHNAYNSIGLKLEGMCCKDSDLGDGLCFAAASELSASVLYP